MARSLALAPGLAPARPAPCRTRGEPHGATILIHGAPDHPDRIRAVARAYGCRYLVAAWAPGDDIVLGACHLTDRDPGPGLPSLSWADACAGMGLPGGRA